MVQLSVIDRRTAANMAASEPPLVVDLDGTLLRTDLLIESFFSLLSARPLAALATLASLRHGKAAFKATIAAETDLDFHSLPLNDELVALIRAERAKGRAVYLASATDRRLAEAVAGALELFDGVLASDGKTNLKGAAKAEALVAQFSDGGFDYAGNARADLPVWARARGVIVAGAGARFRHAVEAHFPAARHVDPRRATLRDYARALRCHQWLKNLLIVVPAAAAHRFAPVLAPLLLLAFASFSLCASSVYLFNDLLDLGNDRAHASKRRRPLAAGRINLVHAILLVPALLAGAVALAWKLPHGFLAVLLGYYALTMAYSLWLKRQVTMDVIALACLYGVRLAAGGVVAGVVLSPWFVAFSTFLFLSLGIVKRCTELVDRIAKGDGDPRGRSYIQRDLPMLEAMAVGSGYVAIMVFALYINSPAVTVLYRNPDYLWAICLVLFYWISRILLMVHRGEMHEDPVVFAVTDWKSLVCGALAVAIVLASI